MIVSPSLAAVFSYVIYSLLFTPYHAITLSNWTLIEPSFPKSTKRAICGYNTNTHAIFSVGGFSSNALNVMSYDISCNGVHSHQSLPFAISCSAQCYTQFNNMLYFVRDHSIGSFDLDSHATQYSLSPPLLTARGGTSCLAISEDGRYLFILGGEDASKNIIRSFQIYDLIEGTFTTGPIIHDWAHAIRCCKEMGCTVANGYLYAFGGFTRYAGPNRRILFININNLSNIASQVWIKSTSSLSIEKRFSSAVVFNRAIYNIGGDSDVVDRINIDTALASVDTHLPISRNAHQCTLAVDDRIYVIDEHNIFMAHLLGSTLEPTVFVTCNPTFSPTNYPTNEPTNPTLHPTNYPTINPSLHPSLHPTMLPTVPSLHPSDTPSVPPTGHATSPIESTQNNEKSGSNNIASNNNNLSTILMVLFLVIIVVALLCICVVGCLWLRHPIKRMEKEVDHMTKAQKSDDTDGMTTTGAHAHGVHKVPPIITANGEPQMGDRDNDGEESMSDSMYHNDAVRANDEPQMGDNDGEDSMSDNMYHNDAVAGRNEGTAGTTGGGKADTGGTTTTGGGKVHNAVELQVAFDIKRTID